MREPACREQQVDGAQLAHAKRFFGHTPEHENPSHMAVVIRMRRTGRKNRPCFRINVTDSRFPRDGRMLETLGLYDPIRKDPAAQLKLDVERARHWLAVGAKPSETVTSIFKRQGILEVKPKLPRERPGRNKTTKTSSAALRRRSCAASARRHAPRCARSKSARQEGRRQAGREAGLSQAPQASPHRRRPRRACAATLAPLAGRRARSPDCSPAPAPSPPAPVAQPKPRRRVLEYSPTEPS